MTSTPGIGHNRGPEVEGASWRTHCWRHARAALLPTLPIEVVRLRVTRARELGLDYRTYAGVRASTGRDLVGFLFSTNALGLLRPTDRLPDRVGARLAGLAADRAALVQPPLDPGAVLALAPLDAAHAAPRSTDAWSAARDRLRGLLRDRRLPPDAVLLVAETAAEREWAEAARLAGVIPGARYFAPLPA